MEELELLIQDAFRKSPFYLPSVYELLDSRSDNVNFSTYMVFRRGYVLGAERPINQPTKGDME